MIFEKPTQFIASKGRVVRLLSGNFNGDSFPDLVWTNYASKDVNVLLGKRGLFNTGVLEEQVVTSKIINNDEDAHGYHAYALASAYGYLFVTDFTGCNLHIKKFGVGGLLKDPVLSPGFSSIQKIGCRASNVVTSPDIGDRLDVVTSNYMDGTVSIFALSHALNDNDNSKSLKIINHGTRAVGHGPNDVVMLDVDSDGYADIITANSLEGTLSILYGDNEGSFNEYRTVKIANNYCSRLMPYVSKENYLMALCDRPENMQIDNGEQGSSFWVFKSIQNRENQNALELKHSYLMPYKVSDFTVFYNDEESAYIVISADGLYKINVMAMFTSGDMYGKNTNIEKGWIFGYNTTESCLPGSVAVGDVDKSGFASIVTSCIMQDGEAHFPGLQLIVNRELRYDEYYKPRVADYPYDMTLEDQEIKPEQAYNSVSGIAGLAEISMVLIAGLCSYYQI